VANPGWAGAETVQVVMAGVLQSIWIAEAASQPLRGVTEVRAWPGRGLEGDRYFLGRGSFSRWPGAHRAVTLIAQEVLEIIQQESGLDLGDGRSRRNLVTAGISLDELQGCRFRVGATLLRGSRPCAPCHYLERLVGPGAFEALRGRGGLRAEILEEATLRIGDPIEV